MTHMKAHNVIAVFSLHGNFCLEKIKIQRSLHAFEMRENTYGNWN